MTTLARPRPRNRRSRAGWIPNQHGAWAMLLTPYLLGVTQRVLAGGWSAHLLPLFGTWLFGYFAFFAASQWLKSHRQPRFRRPMLTWTAVAAGFGVLTLLWGTPVLLTWVPAYAVLLTPALVLAWRRHERDLLGGLLTTAAASLMAQTVRFDSAPAALGSSWLLPLVCFGYFFGTVLYVKTLIRERGSRPWLAASIGYHAAGALGFAVAAALGAVSIWVPVFFAALTARAALVPLLGPGRGRTVTPKQAGIGEAVATVVLVGLVLGLGLG
ncbi:YwiC-like family protein [Granulicoccus phenolivorans]|uniref:YwiC-like family protein n=1 Tax=Granulicoccus phenolivorans TaxID=266854 RepID=UPI00047BA825|nr:YwiC-like family protein [Granulicoccus phenolivorans]